MSTIECGAAFVGSFAYGLKLAPADDRARKCGDQENDGDHVQNVIVPGGTRVIHIRETEAEVGGPREWADQQRIELRKWRSCGCGFHLLAAPHKSRGAI